LRPQSCPLFFGHLKGEVSREPSDVPFDLLIQALRGYAVCCGKVVTENDPLAANHDNCPVQMFDWYQISRVFGRGHERRIPARDAESRRGAGPPRPSQKPKAKSQNHGRMKAEGGRTKAEGGRPPAASYSKLGTSHRISISDVGSTATDEEEK